jgi:hypothetical protein
VDAFSWEACCAWLTSAPLQKIFTTWSFELRKGFELLYQLYNVAHGQGSA